MGTPQTIYFGGLLRAVVRYFDIENNRPGLPSEVSALVEGLQQDQVSLRLVNLHPVEQKELIIQAGAFGEHQFTDIQYLVIDETGEALEKQSKPINGKYVKIILPPSTSIVLEIGIDRFTNMPSYRFPWHEVNDN